MFGYYLRLFNNILNRELSFIIKYYLHKLGNRSYDNSLIFMADGKIIHGGLFDRLKGIISIYALSKVQSSYFGILFVDPFKLEDYLEPNLYNWKTNSNVFFSFPFSRPVIAYSEYSKPWRLLKQRNGQTHYYFGYNILDNINKKYNTCFSWGILFNELFKPSDILEKRIKELKEEIGKPYIAIHLRFMNLLGDEVEIKDSSPLPNVEKNELLHSCIIELRDMFLSYVPKGFSIFVSTDSNTFLSILNETFPEIFTVEGSVKHIDNVISTSDSENMKLFLDMFLIAGAEKVYSIVGPGMHPSAFPEYSAKIEGKPFERIYTNHK